MKATEVKKNIIKLANAEQKYRKTIFKPGYTRTESDLELLRKMDKESTEYMKQVIAEFGLPTIPLVGEKASLFAWLLVQHSADREFQKQYLELMKNAKKDEILAKNIAYLEDRLLVFEEKPQVYGTQVRKNKETGNWEIYPLESPDKVDALRKSVELDSLQDYLKSFE